METLEFKYPKNASKASEEKANFGKFRKDAPLVKDDSIENPDADKFKPINAKKLIADDVIKLHSISNSTNPLAEAISNQKSTPDEVINTLSTSIITLEYTKMKGAYKKAMETASALDKPKIEKTYKDAINNFKVAYGTIGLKNLGEKDFDAFSSELLRDKDAFNTIVTIENSKKQVARAPKIKFEPTAISEGKFETTVGKIDDLLVGNTVLPRDLCQQPLVQGSFVRHFSNSFSIRVTLSLPCVTRYCWGIPCGFGICSRTYTIANLRYNVDLNIGYRVTCCGGAAWGSASANVCASLLGLSFCAGCSASIIGVAGISRTPVGSNCVYGVGFNAQFRCTFGGVTVLNVTVPFGHNFTGPCPPLPC